MSSVVCIVGRANVGKSSLFNRIVGEQRSITDNIAGITRDRIYATTRWLDKEFSIVDTGGITLSKELFSEEIFAQTSYAIDEADVIIFLVNCRNGICEEDLYISKLLKKSKKQLILAVNFVDDNSLISQTFDFYQFGFEKLFPVSALHGIGVGDLLDEVVQKLPKETEVEYDANTMKVAIIGQPNVGKSTLANTLVGQNRTIVSDIPGTTRDSIDTKIKYFGKEIVIIDTAGIRKQGKVYENAEKYSYLRAISAIERSDCVLFLLDSTKQIEEQDKRILGHVKELNKAIIIVLNKWDLIQKDNNTFDEYTKRIQNNFQFINYAPIISLSAINRSKTTKLFELILKVFENYNRRIQTSLLNDIIIDAITLTPPALFNGGLVKIYYANNTSVSPPTIILFVNDEKYLHFSYLRYLENVLRRTFDYQGSPIKFVIRRKNEYED